MKKIDQTSLVTLHFSLQLESGELVDGTYDKTPPTLTMGDGNLLPSFEQLLIGLSEGESAEFEVGPETAFGQRNENNIQSFNRSQFAGMSLETGTMVSFADAAKAELPGVVQKLDGDNVWVDFNHPLAGKTLLFKVTIEGVV